MRVRVTMRLMPSLPPPRLDPSYAPGAAGVPERESGPTRGDVGEFLRQQN